VTWVEHVEVDDRGVHNLYKQLVSTGHAFGAKRWVATLDRQCERLASSMSTNIPTVDVGGIFYFYKNVLKLEFNTLR
jgi:homeobox-leucine zipper protein